MKRPRTDEETRCCPRQRTTWAVLTAPTVVAALTFGVLSGCTTSAERCDPTQRDFFNNTSCLASGAYGERQRAMQSTLDLERRRNAAFRAMLTELEAEQAQVRGQLRTREADYARLDSAWRALKQSLADESGTNPRLASRIEAIDSGVQARKGVDAGADANAKRQTRDDLRLKVSMLERELSAGLYD